MEWIGQQVYDFVATFRSGIIIDDINITTIQSSSESFADNDTSLMTSAAIDDRINAASSASDLTISNFAGSTIITSSESFADNDTTLMTSAAIDDRIGATSISGVRLTADDSNTATDTSGSADFTIAGGTYIDTSVSGATLSIAVREAAVTSLGKLTTIGNVNETTNIAAGDLTMYNAVNDGNPTISLGSSATERLEIQATYETGAQGLDVVKFITHTAGASANDSRYAFQVDETFILNIKDNGLQLKASGELEIGSGNTILSDSSGTTTLSNIDALDATTESTIETAIDTLSNLTTVGTIGTGVWQGTAIATDYTKHLQHFDFQGYGTGDGTNFEISKQVSVNTAPFNHDTSIGSDGLTAQTVQTWMRAGGKVMPKACTLKRITGWSTCAGSATANIGLFKVTPTRNNNSNVSAVELADISYTALGNAKMEDHDVTSFTATAIAAGDILFTALKAESGSIQYFSLTIEVEF